MTKNVQTTTQLCSFHMLARQCSKSFKISFNNKKTEKFQMYMYKLGLEKQRNQKSNSQHLLNYRKSKGIPEKKKIYSCFIRYAKSFDCVDHNKLWKFHKEMGIPDYLTCLLKSLCASQDSTLRTGHGTADWFQIGKGVYKGYILSPCLHNFHAEYIIWNSVLDK